MQILLINPACHSPLGGIISKHYPLNLAYLGTYLEREGFKVDLLDLNVERIDIHKFKELLFKINPQVVGITAMTNTFNVACRIAAIIKEASSQIKIIAGGQHVTALPDETLNTCKAIDCVVMGEGEKTLAEVCTRIKNSQTLEGVKGALYRSDSGIKHEAERELIANLDDLPFPRRDYIGISKYKKNHVSRGISRQYLNIAEMFLSRGCPGRCIFCAANVSWQNKIRFRSIPNILAEIEYCKEELNADHFSFEDDSFTFNRGLVEALCNELRKKKVTWNCNLRVDMVTPDLLRLMAESGCIKVLFGIESGSQRILDLIQKNITLEQVERAVEWANQAGIKFIEGSFIMGVHPEETLEDISSTLSLIKRLKINSLMLALACPLPGTRLYDLLKRESPHNEIAWRDFMFYGKKRSLSTTKYVSSNHLDLLQKKAYLDFYLKPSLIRNVWNNSKTFAEKSYFVISGMYFLKSLLPAVFHRTRKDAFL